ncbi:MAG: hypothetical protein PHV34_10515 [Verrucomicrobiae bacterium]|nr:hypothetical protein [Verrucomicrobiae bacterium]
MRAMGIDAIEKNLALFKILDEIDLEIAEPLFIQGSVHVINVTFYPRMSGIKKRAASIHFGLSAVSLDQPLRMVLHDGRGMMNGVGRKPDSWNKTGLLDYFGNRRRAVLEPDIGFPVSKAMLPAVVHNNIVDAFF